MKTLISMWPCKSLPGSPKSMYLERFPFELIALIYFFMGPFTQSTFRKTCKQFHERLELSRDIFEESGILRVWDTYQMWGEVEEDSLMKQELQDLLLDQPSFCIFARYLLHGVQAGFDPFADLDIPFIARLGFLAESRPILNMKCIDPEVLALLVSMYPKEMMTDKWYGGRDSDDADECDELLLRSYSSNKRAKRLLKTVFSAHPISLQNLLVYHPNRFTGEYLGNGLICTLLKRSRTDHRWCYEYLEDLVPFLVTPKAIQLFYKVNPDSNVPIILDFLVQSLKLDVPVSEIERCKHFYCFEVGEEISEASRQILLHSCANEEAFLMDYMCRFAEESKRFTWTDDDDRSAADLGYSQAFRDKMKELHDEAPKTLFLRIKSYFT